MTPSSQSVSTPGALRYSRLALARKHPFFAKPVFADLRLVVREHGDSHPIGPIPTAAVTMDELHACGAFFEELTLDEAVFVLAHEATHWLACHPRWMRLWNKTRRVVVNGVTYPYDGRTMNEAMDYWINDMLVRNCVGRMPYGGLWSSSYSSERMTVLDIYAQLMQPSDQSDEDGSGGNSDDNSDDNSNDSSDDNSNDSSDDNSDGSSDDSSGGQPQGYASGQGRNRQPFDMHVPDAGAGADGTGHDPSEKDIERQTKERITVAVKSAEAVKPGSSPGAFKSLVDDWRRSQVRWDTALLRMLQARAEDGEDTRKGSVRKRRLFNSPPVVRRRLSADRVGKIVIAIDTSGSVTDEQMSHFFGELRHIFTDVKPEETYVIWCDYEIQRIDHFEDDPEEAMDTMRYVATVIPGRGGTLFSPPFDWLAERGIKPDQFVYLTDGYADFKMPVPDFPCLWVMTGAVTAPKRFGPTVRLRVV